MARWILLVFGLFGLLVFVGLRLFLAPAQADAADPKATALSGKPIFIQAKDSVAFTLERPEIRQLGGRSFVVGRETKDSPYHLTKEQFGGSLVWVPVDAITSLVELESPKREK